MNSCPIEEDILRRHQVADPLAQSLAAGNPSAFAELYDRFAARLVKTARRMGCHPAATEDIVHDLFVAMARSRANFENVDNLDAYVFTALRHAVARHQQRRRLEHAARSRVAENLLRRDDGATDSRLHRPMNRSPTHWRACLRNNARPWG